MEQGKGAIHAHALRFRYQKQTAALLSGVNFVLPPGRIAAIMGPSGSGKSTLGYCLCGLIPHQIKGEYEGEVVRSGRAGIVFQDPDNQLFLPTVEDELAFGPENLCHSSDEIEDRIAGALRRLGIEHLRGERPSELSGGQKLLVAFAAVLAYDPAIFVLDELLAQLDEGAIQKVKTVVRELRDAGKAIVLIEHDEKNIDFADEVWALGTGGELRPQAATRAAGGADHHG